MRGFVYVIREVKSRRVKIGHSANPFTRARSLQTGNPDTLQVEAMVRGAQEDEAAYHGMLAHERVRGEWFSGKDTESLVEMMRTRPPLDDDVSALIHRTVQLAAHCGANALWDPFVKPGADAWCGVLHDAMRAAAAGGVVLHADERMKINEFLFAAREIGWEPNEKAAQDLKWIMDAVDWPETWADELVSEYEPPNETSEDMEDGLT